jgi:RimJ/RimL family protein N-acetyltransferase
MRTASDSYEFAELQSERLTMRPLTGADAAVFCNLYGDPETMRFVGPALSRERAERSFRIALRSLGRPPVKRVFMVIVEKAVQRAIGICAFQDFDVCRRRVEAGMVLDSQSRGKGFGKEGLCALITHAFAVFAVDEVWIQHSTENSIAERVPLSLGLERNAEFRVPGMCVWSAYRQSWSQINRG